MMEITSIDAGDVVDVVVAANDDGYNNDDWCLLNTAALPANPLYCMYVCTVMCTYIGTLLRSKILYLGTIKYRTVLRVASDARSGRKTKST